MSERRIWYAAYGSNISHERFRCYLEGGSYQDGHRPQVGARNSSPPGRLSPLLYGPWTLSFACSSERWGGGVAFLELDRAGGAAIRCWDITEEQFLDVAAQENGLEPGEFRVDLDEVVAADQLVHGDSWYSKVIYLGMYLGSPVLTFTNPTPVEFNAPGRPYLSVILKGLMEASPLQLEMHLSQLMRANGISPAWTKGALRDIVDFATDV